MDEELGPRLITWNCNMKFRTKAQHVLVAEPDIMVIQECEQKHGLPFQHLWFGKNKNKGIAVFASSKYKLSLHPSYNPEFRYIIPIQVTGKDTFNLFAVWAMYDKENPQRRYVAQVWHAINYYEDLLNEPTMIVGDFNWNIRWDTELSSKIDAKWTDVADLLKSKGITSVYHRCGKTPFGKEERPTYYHHKDINQGYHTDYCFVSENFKIEKVGITDPEGFLEFSDHMALIADFE